MISIKKKIKLKHITNKKKYKIFIYLFIFIIFLSLTFNYLLSKNININNKLLVEYLLKSSTNTSIQKNNKNIEISVIDILNLNYLKLSSNSKSSKKIETKKEEPLIYLYNTHQLEEYTSADILNTINPTVTINNYIMKDIFDNNNLKTITEERSIKDLLNINSWNYASSYKASRMYLEDVKKNNPSLKYFIDIHRDSVKKDKTTVEISNKSYAKILFIVGLENPTYQENLEFTEKINNKVIEKYPDLSKGIYKKSGPGVNGVYNQDFSKYTILIEIGGSENTVDEVMNTSLLVANIISEVIKNEG